VRDQASNDSILSLPIESGLKRRIANGVFEICFYNLCDVAKGTPQRERILSVHPPAISGPRPVCTGPSWHNAARITQCGRARTRRNRGKRRCIVATREFLRSLGQQISESRQWLADPKVSVLQSGSQSRQCRRASARTNGSSPRTARRRILLWSDRGAFPHSPLRVRQP
jgi:hypothetical protein